MNGIRVGLLSLFGYSVLAFGTVEVWSESLLEIGASILLISWAVIAYRDKRSSIAWSPLNWPLLWLFAVGIVQLAFHWTANPFLTRLELLRLAAYFILFFLTAHALRERADFVKLAWFLLILGFAVALLGIVQQFTSEGTIYWFRELPRGGDVFGPYVNRNHFAGFVELVAPIGLSLLVFRGLRQDRFPMVALLTIIPIGALILSASRGGIVSFAFEVGVLVLLARTRSRPESPQIFAVGVAALAAIALITWLGAGKAIERLSNTRAGDVTLIRRASMFRDARKCFVAEQGHFSRALHAGAIASVCGLLLHSMVDFNLHIPSNALLFLLQAYIATSPPLPSELPMQRQRIRSRERPPFEE